MYFLGDLLICDTIDKIDTADNLLWNPSTLFEPLKGAHSDSLILYR